MNSQMLEETGRKGAGGEMRQGANGLNHFRGGQKGRALRRGRGRARRGDKRKHTTSSSSKQGGKEEGSLLRYDWRGCNQLGKEAGRGGGTRTPGN